MEEDIYYLSVYKWNWKTKKKRSIASCKLLTHTHTHRLSQLQLHLQFWFCANCISHISWFFSFSFLIFISIFYIIYSLSICSFHTLHSAVVRTSYLVRAAQKSFVVYIYIFLNTHSNTSFRLAKFGMFSLFERLVFNLKNAQRWPAIDRVSLLMAIKTEFNF